MSDNTVIIRLIVTIHSVKMRYSPSKGNTREVSGTISVSNRKYTVNDKRIVMDRGIFCLESEGRRKTIIVKAV